MYTWVLGYNLSIHTSQAKQIICKVYYWHARRSRFCPCIKAVLLLTIFLNSLTHWFLWTNLLKQQRLLSSKVLPHFRNIALPHEARLYTSKPPLQRNFNVFTCSARSLIDFAKIGQTFDRIFDRFSELFPSFLQLIPIYCQPRILALLSSLIVIELFAIFSISWIAQSKEWQKRKLTWDAAEP